MNTETPRQTAERIANEFLLAGNEIPSRTSSAFGNNLESQSLRRLLTDVIEAALNAERESAARTAEKHRSHCLHCETALAIVNEIRGKD